MTYQKPTYDISRTFQENDDVTDPMQVVDVVPGINLNLGPHQLTAQGLQICESQLAHHQLATKQANSNL